MQETVHAWSSLHFLITLSAILIPKYSTLQFQLSLELYSHAIACTVYAPQIRLRAIAILTNETAYNGS